MSQKSPARLEAEKLCKQFPRAGTRTLASMLMEKMPMACNSLEAARSVIKRARGLAERSRGKEDAQPAREFDPMNGFPVSEYEAPIKYHIDTERCAVFSDIHYPDYDTDTLRCAINEAKRRNVDTLILNGDTFDFEQLGRWGRSRDRVQSGREMVDGGRQLMRAFREQFPKAQIIFKVGNHDERLEKYFWNKAAEVCGVDDFQLDAIMRMNQHGIKYIKSSGEMQIGGHMDGDKMKNGLMLIHGHEAKVNGGVNCARALFLKLNRSAMCGHLHKLDQHTEKTGDGTVVSAWVTGCMCGYGALYNTINKWTHGCAFVEVSSEDFMVDNRLIIDGKIY